MKNLRKFKKVTISLKIAVMIKVYSAFNFFTTNIMKIKTTSIAHVCEHAVYNQILSSLTFVVKLK